MDFKTIDISLVQTLTVCVYVSRSSQCKQLAFNKEGHYFAVILSVFRGSLF